MTKYTQSVLEKKTKPDLLEIAEELDLELESKINKQGIVEAIIAAQEAGGDDDEVEDDELDDIEEPELDDEEDDVEVDEVDEVDEEPVKKTKAVAKKTKTASSDENTLAAKQVAALVGTDAKTIRQFFRSPASTVEAVGSGGRYEFLETDIPKIKQEFEAWSSNRGKRASTGGSGSKKSRAAARVTDEVVEVEEIEELEEVELDDLDEDDIELED